LIGRLVPVLALAGALASCGSRDRRSPPGEAGAAVDRAAAADGGGAPPSRHLLLFGLDGATWSRMDPLLARGRLPNLARLIERGTRAPLRTIRPTISPLVWTTIATGVPPERHGIGWFTADVPGTGERLLVTSNLRRADALWNVLSRAGRRVGVVGWWATYPAEPVDGFVVSDQACRLRAENYAVALGLDPGAGPGPRAGREVHPPELGAKLADVLQVDARAEPDLLARFMDAPPERARAVAGQSRVDIEDPLSVFRFALLIDRSLIDAGLRALGEHQPAFAAVYLNGLDSAEHCFWKYVEPERFPGVAPGDVARYGRVIDEYYAFMDQALGRFLAAFPADDLTVVVVSDHGQEANPEHDPASADHFDRTCSGTHEDAPDGILILSGKDVAAGARPERPPTVYDVAPTVLALMGVPVGRDMPGRVLGELLRAGFLAAHPVTTVPTHTTRPAGPGVPVPSPAGEALRDRLRALGYIR
jgi:hypothetical protein